MMIVASTPPSIVAPMPPALKAILAKMVLQLAMNRAQTGSVRTKTR